MDPGLPSSTATKSYWIEAAESSLRNRRSTEDLPEKIDIAIIGSGYTGATSAYWIHKYTENGTTPKMLMLEARDICGGATGRNGGQLRPHFYSRYPPWAQRFTPDGALRVIEHEVAHLTAFKELFEAEGIAEEVCFKMGETFDAAMSEEAWTRLKGALEAMQKDHPDSQIVKDCRLIEDPNEAEEFTQMKGCIGAVVHPTGQVWPYKFVHALLRLVEKTGNLNIQANTPVTKVSKRDSEGYVTLETPRGKVKAKAVIHATNRWAGHLLSEYEKLILAGRGTLAAIKAPEGFIKNTGAQHWDSIVNNYHLQLPPPYNMIIIGGAKPHTVHNPELYINNDDEDTQMPGVSDFYHDWPEEDVLGWKGGKPADFGLEEEKGGIWTGIYSSSIDSFPFVDPVPGSDGHFLAAGFSGHGMPRILLSTADLVPKVLKSVNIEYTPPSLVKNYPPLPAPFRITKERLESLSKLNPEDKYAADIKENLASAQKHYGLPKSRRNQNGPAQNGDVTDSLSKLDIRAHEDIMVVST